MIRPPRQGSSLISQFHDDVRGYGHLDSYETSECFGVNQGFCQGCVIALVFRISFAVMMRVVEIVLFRLRDLNILTRSLLRKAHRGLLLRCIAEHMLTYSAPRYLMTATVRFWRELAAIAWRLSALR